MEASIDLDKPAVQPVKEPRFKLKDVLTLALLVVVLVFSAIPTLEDSTNTPTPNPTTTTVAHTLWLGVDGDAALVGLEYADDSGYHLDAVANKPFKVTNLKWAVVAVASKTAQGVGCSIELDGVTEAAAGSVADVVTVCKYISKN